MPSPADHSNDDHDDVRMQHDNPGGSPDDSASGSSEDSGTPSNNGSSTDSDDDQADDADDNLNESREMKVAARPLQACMELHFAHLAIIKYKSWHYAELTFD